MSGNVTYTTDVGMLSSRQLQGFFVDWPNPPDPDTHLRILRESSFAIVAIDDETSQVVGFITAITDGVLAAYIPLLEVLPAWKRRGIGRELVRRMVEQLRDLYMIDLLCDEDLQPWYERLGFTRSHGMAIRNYPNQSGRA